MVERCLFLSLRQQSRLSLTTHAQVRYSHHLARISETFQPLSTPPPQPGKLTKRDLFLSKSQKLLLETGMVSAASSPGTFNLLPLFIRSVEKLTRLIDHELQAIKCQKISMPSLHDAALWKKTGRWEGMGHEMLKFKDRVDRECCLGPTHEETVTALLATTMHRASYKNFPLRLYQIGPKFRDEGKPKYGLLRAREFLMKDLYTFDTSEEYAKATYEAVVQTYEKILSRLQVPFVKAEASTGAMGGSFSHEFLLPCESLGEDSIQICPNCASALNSELMKDFPPGCPKCLTGTELKQVKAIEVAHAFLLGTKYSKQLGADFSGPDGKARPLIMGCYGVGVTRLIAACLEVLSSEDRLRWPLTLAPYGICVISPKAGSKEQAAAGHLAVQTALKLSQIPQGTGEIILDDREDLTIGRRLNDARKAGYPMIVVVGKTATESVPKLEVHYTDGADDKSMILGVDELLDVLRGDEPADRTTSR